MKNKRKNRALPLLAVCIVIVALAAVAAFKYGDRLFPATETTAAPMQTEPTETETATVSEIKTTQAENEKDGKKETVRNILNCPDIKGAYEPSAFEAKLFNALNEKRTEKGLAPLAWNGCLHAKAKIRADEAVKSFSHTRPDGRKPSTVLTDDKLTFSLFGECLAKGSGENDAGVSLLLNGILRDEAQSTTVFSGDYVYAASAISVDKNGLVTAVILLCNP